MHKLPITGTAIHALIPQRMPMVMVDCLRAYTADTVDTGLVLLAGNIFLQHGVLQEAGLLEHMAQSVALHTGYSFFIRKEQAPTGYIGAIQQAELFRLPLIGEEIQTHVRIIQEFMGVTLVHIESRVADECIATAQMKTVIAAANI
ncbi:hypothetical protein ACL9RF_08430 [Sphingobacterium sp. Mn56C]|uniref:hypothetical protein n=1 Tax=Sphingobacterium sp. Mn56C TaxID=3395261 RepID=UPI003BD0C99C